VIKLILTTNPGIEDIVVNEISERLNREVKHEKFLNMQGRVLVEINEKEINEIFNLFSVYHTIKLIGVFDIDTNIKGLDIIYENIKNLDIEELKQCNTFRVTSDRIGKHEFTSLDIQKFAGKAIVDKYSKKVDLKNYDINIIVDVIGEKCYVGIKLTKEMICKKFKKVFNHPASIKIPLAYAMIKLAGMKKDESLLDPFCGGGTIPITAALLYKNYIRIYGSDINEKYIQGAIKNAESAKVKDLIEFRVLDVREIEKYYSNIDKIVTNPPYGVRMGKLTGIKKLYKDFLISSKKVLTKDGKIVFITLRTSSFRNIVLNSESFLIEHERVVEAGGLFPHIFVLRKI